MPGTAVAPGIPLNSCAPGVLPVSLLVEDEKLVAVPHESASPQFVQRVERAGESVVVLVEPTAYFIPEHVEDPSRRLPGEELWVEVTLPKKGPPRPIRLGVKKNGSLQPLDLL